MRGDRFTDMYIMSLVASLIVVVALRPLPAEAAEAPYNRLWRQGGDLGFQGWSLAGARLEQGRILLDSATPQVAELPDTARQLLESVASGHVAGNGVALGPELELEQPFRQLIPSWNAETPPGTWIEVRLRARIDGRWTTWYTLGVWSDAGGPELRRSVAGQNDADARVLTDTLALRAPGQAYQLALGLFSRDPSLTPSVSLAAVVASSTSETPPRASLEPQAWDTTLDVPARSQMVYPGGGEVWCSPTSTSMVMAYWAGQLGQPGLDLPVPEVAVGTYDAVYRGHGNWPFNTAYAARDGLIGYVSRFSSIAQVERWIDVGVPVIASLGWGPGELTNAPVRSTDGHLLVIVGFSAEGNVVVNDPAGDPRRGQSVRRVYERAQFESLWLSTSGGTVYLIHPAQQAPPADEAFGSW